MHRHDVTADGTAPGLLNAYGAYGISSDPWFSVLRLSLLDRGWVFAIAHVRGGSELGRSWYDDGKLEAKPNTFTDFIACADHLVETGVVAPNRLAAEGGSAGGLLMGAVVNLAPERFRFVHAQVPFVDALTTVLDPSLPLTVVEWEEWGNPLEDPAAYALMKSYAPYENVDPAPEPARHGRATTRGSTSPSRPSGSRRCGTPTSRSTRPDPLPHRDGRRPRRPVRSLRPVAPMGLGARCPGGPAGGALTVEAPPPISVCDDLRRRLRRLAGVGLRSAARLDALPGQSRRPVADPVPPAGLPGARRLGPAGALRRTRHGQLQPSGRPDDLGVEAQLRDLDAVLAAAGLEHYAVLGYYHSVPAALAHAAAHPDRVTRMVLFGGSARTRDVMSPSQTQALLSLVEQDWDLFAESAAHAWLGWQAGEAGRCSRSCSGPPRARPS